MITNLSPCLLGGETALWEQGIPYLVAMFHIDHHVGPQLLTPKRCFLTDVVIWSQVMDRYLGWLGMVGWNRWNPYNLRPKSPRKAKIRIKNVTNIELQKTSQKKSTRKWQRKQSPSDRDFALWVAQGDAPRVFTNKAWYSKATGPRTRWKSLIDVDCSNLGQQNQHRFRCFWDASKNLGLTPTNVDDSNIQKLPNGQICRQFLAP